MKKHLLLPVICIFAYACQPEQTQPKPEPIIKEDSTETIVHSEKDSTPYIENLATIPESKSYSDWHSLLIEKWDSIGSSKTYYDSNNFGEIDLCVFEQTFENGIHYKYYGCGEGGDVDTIIFPGFTKNELYNMINSYLFIEENIWNKDSTAYEADGAGCYYNIIEKQDSVMITTYCGC